MNSYPVELLAQLAPVMFVAGLDIPLDAQEALQSTPPKYQDPFIVLALRLREALVSQRKPAMWQPEKSKTFQVALVDPEVRFPPRKMPPPEDQPFAQTHSPLSPLTPSSPLYPDGLIAPIWIRKHTSLVPSVFVLFKRIYESPQPANRNPLDHDPEAKEREAEERKRDAELSAEIALRKKSTNERNIKLTVVLMASRRMLDDPTLDGRLTYIRRQSGLDPRAALFVLSPVSPSEIGDFVKSLQEALYDPAVEYYTNHSKRVRRKRNKHAQASSGYQLPLSPSYGSRPLRPEGWTVRYEYKMACFAEFRGEDEIALKHYQDSYNALHIMFGSTAILPPRTKRWAEAKVLADCINVKICKLYLYNNEHSLALAHHNSHMRKISDLSRGWGIGEETFEYWAWLARQNRVFAELLEQGTRTTLKIPTHLPVKPPPATADPRIAQANPLESDSLKSLGLNPSQALQHPGFYYYMAARCTENRRDRFLHAGDNEVAMHAAAASPGFANEKKVDHLSIVLELYTRAYELFKKYAPRIPQNQGRQTLWIAYRIAQTYYQSGKFEMAVRFFERIAKTYRREKWEAMLQPLLTTWFACARQLGNMEMCVQLLLEMLGHGLNPDSDDPDAIQEDLIAVLKTSMPSTPDGVLVADLSESDPLLDTSVVFWKSEVTVGEPAAFQLSLAASSTLPISSLPFTSLSIHFLGEFPTVIIRHKALPTNEQEKEDLSLVKRVDIGSLQWGATVLSDDGSLVVEADLRWGLGSTMVICGTLTSDIPVSMSVEKLVLTMKEGSWSVELPILPNSRRSIASQVPRWLSSLSPPRFIPIQREHTSSVTVQYRPHRIYVAVSNDAPAYLGEEFPIIIDIINGDDRELDIVIDVLLHPTEIEEAVSYITFDSEQSAALIKGISCGTLSPGGKVSKTLNLGTSGAPGDRMLDISVQSRSTSISAKLSESTPADTGETLRTLVVSVIDPINVAYDVVYKRSSKPQRSIADLETYEGDYWDDGDGGVAHVVSKFSCAAPSGVHVESVKLTREDNSQAKITSCLLDSDTGDLIEDWLCGDEFCDRCQISIAPDDDYSKEDFIAGPGTYEITWKRILPEGAYGTSATSYYRLPSLQPPPESLIALMDVPTTATMHQPFGIQLTVRNRHPSRSAYVVVQLEPEATDAFVVAGLRNGRLPILLPGCEEVIRWNLIPVECGFVKIPKIKVMNRRKVIDQQAHARVTGGITGEDPAPEEPVEIVDIRWDDRSVVAASSDAGTTGSGAVNRYICEAVVLVLP
ncbi:hypothetical protein ABKN59_006671 [Abortiporus biennis]